MTAFRFVEREKGSYPVTTMCRLLDVSASGYCGWRDRGPSERTATDGELSARIGAIHRLSWGTYGAPWIHAELRFSGTCCSRKRVARLMRASGLKGVDRRRFVRTTVRDRDAAPAPDLVERSFRASRPNQLSVADITYLPTWQGFLYLAAVVDVFSRHVVGWSMAGTCRPSSSPARSTWRSAVDDRPRGSSTTPTRAPSTPSLAFRRRAREAGVALSMGSVGDSFDNALAESFFASLEAELIDHSSWRTRAEPGSRCSTTSRPSTTSDGVTRRWTISARPSSRGGTVPRHLPPNRQPSTEAGQLHTTRPWLSCQVAPSPESAVY